jgi:hypothetical protein
VRTGGGTIFATPLASSSVGSLRFHRDSLTNVLRRGSRAGALTDKFSAALDLVAHERVAELGLAEARAYWGRGLDVTKVSVRTIQHLPPSPAREAWGRALWDRLVEEQSARRGFAVRALATTLPRDEAFALAARWCDEPKEAETRAERLMAVAVLRDARCLDLIENWWARFRPARSRYRRVVPRRRRQRPSMAGGAPPPLRCKLPALLNRKCTIVRPKFDFGGFLCANRFRLVERSHRTWAAHGEAAPPRGGAGARWRSRRKRATRERRGRWSW